MISYPHPLSLIHTRFQTIFLKVIHKLHKEHISTTAVPSDVQAVSELLQLSLELMKGRVTSMPQEARKGFFTILTSLIEKSTVRLECMCITFTCTVELLVLMRTPLIRTPLIRKLSFQGPPQYTCNVHVHVHTCIVEPL